MAFFARLVLPPVGPLLLLVAGLWIARRRPRAGRWMGIVGTAALLLSAMPYVSSALLRTLQLDAALPARGELPRAGAIVVLGADYVPQAPELGRAAAGKLTAERLSYGASLHRRSGLPLLVTGGKLLPNAPALGVVMRQTLEEDHRVEARWVERAARNTRENARGAARLLGGAGIRRVLLVTHAWHMPRARGAFEAAGLEVIPAPMGFRGWPPFGVGSFVPSAKSLQETYWALHEWLGRAWYAVRG